MMRETSVVTRAQMKLYRKEGYVIKIFSYVCEDTHKSPSHNNDGGRIPQMTRLNARTTMAINLVNLFTSAYGAGNRDSYQ